MEKIGNYTGNLQELLRAYREKDVKKELEYFDCVFQYLMDNNRKKDAFYLLFLHGYCFGIPNKYIDIYMEMYDEITKDYDTICDGIRDDIYNVCFSDAKKILRKKLSSFEDENEIELERFLIEKGINRYYRVENKVNQKAIVDEFNSILKFLKSLDSFKFLSFSQKDLLYLVNVYIESSLSGNVPNPISENVPMVFPLLIQTNNFILAKQMLDEYYDRNPNKDRTINATYYVLSKIVSLISVKEEANTDEHIESVNDKVVDDEKKSLIEDLIALVREKNVSFDEALKRLPLSDDLKNQAMLLMARDCYYKGNINDGDRYLNIVEKKSHKGSDMKKQVSLLRSRKKFLQFDEKKVLVFTKWY